MNALATGCLAVAVFAAGSLNAQDASGNAGTNGEQAIVKADSPSNPSLFAFGYGATSTPALNLLGLTASKVQSSTNFTPFFLSVPSLFDGSSGQAISLDVSSVLIMRSFGKKLYLQDYPRDDPLYRSWVRARLEIAATNGTDSTSPSKLQQSGIAAAVSTSLLRANDPIASDELRSDFLRCIAPLQASADQAIRASVQEWDRSYAAANFLNQTLSSYKDKREAPGKEAHDSYLARLKKHALQIRAAYNVIAKSLGHLPLGDGLAENVTTSSSARLTPPVANPQAPVLTAAQAMGELRDVFDEYESTDRVSKTKASGYAQELQDMGDAMNLGLPPPDSTTPVEVKRQNLVQYALTVSNEGIGRTIKKLVATPEFSPSPLSPLRPEANASEQGSALDKLTAEIDRRFPDLLADAGKVTSEQQQAFNQMVIAPDLESSGVTQGAANCSGAVAALSAAKPDLNVGVGYAEVGKPGHIADLHDGGKTAWVAYRFPLPWFSNMDPTALSWAQLAKGQGHYFMAGGSVTYSYHASLTTGQANVPIMQADVLGMWLGTQGYFSQWKGALQAGYTRTTAVESSNASLSSKGWRWLFSVSHSLFDSMWLSATYGTANGSSAKLHDRTVLISITFQPPKTTSDFAPPPPTKASQ